MQKPFWKHQSWNIFNKKHTITCLRRSTKSYIFYNVYFVILYVFWRYLNRFWKKLFPFWYNRLTLGMLKNACIRKKFKKNFWELNNFCFKPCQDAYVKMLYRKWFQQHTKHKFNIIPSTLLHLCSRLFD
jgi:hypothetical protein